MNELGYLLIQLIKLLLLVGTPVILFKLLRYIFEEIGAKIRNRKKPKYVYERQPDNDQPEFELDLSFLEEEIKKQEYNQEYQPRYLMTLNEKSQYRKIQTWAEQKDLIVFTKVRLLDLIEPRRNKNNYNARLWKIQAKHIDFVVCDKEIRVKCIIEINDNSHKHKDRVERDQFINEVLTACGYKVLQTYNVTNEELDRICGYNTSTIEEQNSP